MEKRQSLAAFWDSLIEKGGTWDYIEKEGNIFARSHNLKTRTSEILIRAHINFRLKKDPNYLGKRKVTAKGIE
jgi:hypothetical protein